MEIQTYQWGADVYCGSEVCAKLARVVVDPQKAVVTDVIVEQGLLMKKAWVIPRRHIQQAESDGIWLDLTAEELTSAKPYKRRVIEEVAAGYTGSTATSPANVGVPDMGAVPMVSRVVHDGVASDELRVLGQGLEIRDLVTEKSIGRLKQMSAAASSGEIVQLTVSKGLLGEETTLDPSTVRYYEEERIVVDTDLAPNAAAAVQSTVGADVADAPSAVAGPELEVDMEPQGDVVRNAAPKLPLAARIERAFDDDARTRDEVIEVVEQHGVVTLVGEVASVEASHAAQEIAAKQPGVISVQSNLKVRH